MGYNSDLIKDLKKKKIFQSEHDTYKKKILLQTEYKTTNLLGFTPKLIYPYLLSDTYNRYYKMKGYNVLNAIGLCDMSFTGLMLSKEKSLTLDEFIKPFQDTIDNIGIGYDPTKFFKTSNYEFSKFLQSVFVKLYNKDIFYKKREVFTPILLDKTYNEFDIFEKDFKYYHKETGEEVYKRDESVFVLDIKKYHEKIREEINKLEIDESIKESFHEALKNEERLKVTFSNKELSISSELKNPGLLASVNFIAINPSLMDVLPFVSEEEEETVKKYLVNGYQEGVFSGTILKNPLTFEDVYLFISYDFPEAIHLGLPDISLNDIKYQNVFGIPSKKVLENNLLIDSDFLTGYSLIEANEIIKKAFTDEGLGEIINHYTLDEIIISSKDYYGIPIPIYESEDNLNFKALDEYYLPVTLNKFLKPSINNLEELGDISLVSETMNNYFISGLSKAAIHLVENDATADKPLNFNEENKYFISYENTIKEILMPLIFKIILNLEYGKEEYVILTDIKEDYKEIIDTKKLNLDIINIILGEYDPDSTRLLILTKHFSNNLEKLSLNISSYKDFIEGIKEYYYNNLGQQGPYFEPKLQNLKKTLNESLKKYDIKSYIEKIMDFYYQEIQAISLSKKDAYIYLKYLSIVAPFISQQIYEEVYKEKYYIVYEKWE